MRLGIKAKQAAGVTSIVGLVVVVLSLMHLASLARVQLQESQARGDLLAIAIYHRAREVVDNGPDPYGALRADPGLRSILESSIYSKNVTYAAILDATGVVVVHSDPGREGKSQVLRGDLAELVARSAPAQLQAIYSEDARTLEVRRPLLLGTEEFGSIRVGVSTLLIRQELTAALTPPLITALVALLVATGVAMLLAQLLLRPIHLIRSGLTRLGEGKFDVKLDLPMEDEFKELGTSFNAVSAQLSADRTQLAGQQSIIEHLEDAVAIFNSDGELLFANPAMHERLPADPIGRPIDDLLPAGHPFRTTVEDALRAPASRGPVVVTVDVPAGADSDARTDECLVMTHSIQNLDKRMLVLIVQNQSARGQLQSTVTASRRLMKLNRLSAGVAHEVKNPLNAMMIHLELLRGKLAAAGNGRSGGSGSAQAVSVAHHRGSGSALATEIDRGSDWTEGALEHVRVITDEIRRLDTRLQGFMKFTKPEDPKMQLVQLETVIDDVVNVMRPEAERTNVTVQVTCSRQLPDVYADPTMLREAFLNLARNACQAMPSGGVLHIRCGAARGRRVNVEFEDTGHGIQPEHLERIFDLYFSTKEQGSGIGLTMVYRIVHLHTGEIEVTSTPGAGTTFTMSLPQA